MRRRCVYLAARHTPSIGSVLLGVAIIVYLILATALVPA